MNLNYKEPSKMQSYSPALDGGTLRDDEGFTPTQVPVSKRGFLTVIRSRADIGVHSFLQGITIIGRSPACSFTLHDHKVSGRHAAITPTTSGEFVLEDLGSTNGTKVGGFAVVGPQSLSDGEKIIMGETVIRFSLADEFDVDFHSEVATLVGTDPLTGLPSKRRFDESLDFAIQNATRNKMPLTVLMMDMDGVKQINDTHGHLYGAHVIGETGKSISTVLGRYGEACRFGGDEFSAFLPGYDLASACTIAENIRESVQTAGFQKDGIALRPTISIGVASVDFASQNSETASLLSLITKADEALYRAKAAGKNCVAR
ncbi:GGDEF domain-containing protein [Planctomycetes bacterium K23_9]|uniref:diguanylate cyclase n=1 Tax=Stieleria marina TaxID=1930275 RepID=A0A517NQ66_9BACT|nr:Response regulator PleD [Planctomycetes bacterium K23_9]